MTNEHNTVVGDVGTGRRFGPGVRFSNRTAAIFMLLTVAGLTLIQEPLGWSWLAWVVLVPWVLASVGAKRLWFAFVAGYLAGLIYFLSNLYWLVGITTPGYGALCFYLAWYFPIVALVLRWVYKRTGWSFIIVLPLLWVGQEYLRAKMLTGFPWLFLGHSQHENLRLIQICDLFGVYGLTFLLCAVNGFICDLLLRPIVRLKNSKKRFGPGAAAAALAALVAAVLLYGHWRLIQGERTITPGPLITVVQDVIPQYVRGSEIDDATIFSRHLAHSQEALEIEPKPELIVWPETMTAPLNREFLNLAVSNGFLAASRFQNRTLLLLAQRNDVNLLIGTPTLIYELQDGAYRKAGRWNSALLYEANGDRSQRYHKMHLVPFGEVVPFRYSWPWLYRVLNNLTPYDFEYSLEAGTEPTAFSFASGGHDWRFAVAICYEDVMPEVVRKLTATQNGSKRVDFLLNISNDGWFVRPGDQKGQVEPTSELLQHMVLCKFRAIENRIGIARSVNTGISCFIKPDGTIGQAGLAGTLPDNPRDRQAVAGYLTDRVMLDTRTTIYNQIGDIFAFLCMALSLVMAALAAMDGKRWRKLKTKKLRQP